MKKIISKVSIAIVLVSLGCMAQSALAQNNNGGPALPPPNKGPELGQHDSKPAQPGVAPDMQRGANSSLPPQGGMGGPAGKQDLNQGSNEGDTEDEMDTEEDNADEMSLHDHFGQLPDVKTMIALPPVDATKLVTYADVVTLLMQYKDAVRTIDINGNVLTAASSSLSVAEKAILTKLASKNAFELSRTDARAKEIVMQIDDLIAVLTPLGTSPISTELNLKNLLVMQLNDFTASINSLTTLADTASTIIDEETN